MLARRLREIRLEHNLTQKAIATVLGIDRTTYTLYETGATTPSPDTLYKLSQMYGVTVGYLMGVENNHPEHKLSGAPGEVIFSAGTDPIASLRTDEKTLLLCFRVLSSDAKAKALDYLYELARKTDSI